MSADVVIGHDDAPGLLLGTAPATVAIQAPLSHRSPALQDHKTKENDAQHAAGEDVLDTASLASSSLFPQKDAVGLPPPRPADLQVRLNDDPALGFCVYAARRFARGERLFRERTALEATHDADPRGVRNVYDRYRRLSAERRRALHGAFPALAWANGVDARAAADARGLIDSRIISRPRLVLDVALTAEDHMLMRPDGGLLQQTTEGEGGGRRDDHHDHDHDHDPPLQSLPGAGSTVTAAAMALSTVKSTGTRTRAALVGMFRQRKRKPPRHENNDDFPSEERSHWSTKSAKSSSHRKSADTKRSAAAASSAASAPPPATADAARRETLDWFSRYAFRLKPGSAFGQTGGHHQAAVYLLTDLINHRCAGFQNCRVAAEIGTISVLALRDIEPGEEVTINYSKNVKDFQCKGECCTGKKT